MLFFFLRSKLGFMHIWLFLDADLGINNLFLCSATWVAKSINYSGMTITNFMREEEVCIWLLL